MIYNLAGSMGYSFCDRICNLVEPDLPGVLYSTSADLQRNLKIIVKNNTLCVYYI